MHIACCPLAKGHTPRVCSSDRIVEIRPRCVEIEKNGNHYGQWLSLFVLYPSITRRIFCRTAFSLRETCTWDRPRISAVLHWVRPL